MSVGWTSCEANQQGRLCRGGCSAKRHMGDSRSPVRNTCANPFLVTKSQERLDKRIKDWTESRSEFRKVGMMKVANTYQREPGSLNATRR